MASTTVGPITPTDEQMHERGSRVAFKALGMIDAMLDEKPGSPMNYEKLSVLAAVVQAGTEAMLPPGGDKDDDGDY